MLNVVGRVLGALIQSVTALLFTKNLLENNDKLLKIKNIIYVIFITTMILITYNVKYQIITPIVIFLSIAFILSFLYKYNVSKSCLSAGIFLIVLFLFDIVANIIFVLCSNIEVVRNSFLSLVFTNLFVGVTTVAIIKIKLFKRCLINLVELCENKKNFETITFIILLIASLSIILYMISKDYEFNSSFIINLIGIILFLALSFIYFKEKYEKEIITNNYDQLFEYVKTYEDWIDAESVNTHESKNQLATLRDIVSDNKIAVEYIDNIINERINLESKNTINLKNIPKGGLKGLLFYKIALAENKDIVLFIDVSNKVTKTLNTLTIEEIKILCRLVGIFFDNAIEASKDSNEKQLTCEIYMNGNDLNIVISNTYAGQIDLDKIKNKGYSTKGNGRGIGLYLAHRLIHKSNIFKLENRIINNYFIQRIIIKKNTNLI